MANAVMNIFWPLCFALTVPVFATAFARGANLVDVVDVEAEFGGDVGQVDPAALGVDDLDEPGEPTDGRGGQGPDGGGGFGGRGCGRGFVHEQQVGFQDQGGRS